MAPEGIRYPHKLVQDTGSYLTYLEASPPSTSSALVKAEMGLPVPQKAENGGTSERNSVSDAFCCTVFDYRQTDQYIDVHT
jgi:hypothetical protein